MFVEPLLKDGSIRLRSHFEFKSFSVLSNFPRVRTPTESSICWDPLSVRTSFRQRPYQVANIFSFFAKHQETTETGDDSDARLIRRADGSVMIRPRIPPDYVENTLTPHLEYTICYVGYSLPASRLVDLCEAYSRLPVRQKLVAKHLFRLIKFRWDDFHYKHALRILQPAWALLGTGDVPFLVAIANRLELYSGDLTGLQLIGVMRVYAKLAPHLRPEPFFSQTVVPRAWAALGEFDASELSDILVATSFEHTEKWDRELLELLLLQLVRRYNETSLMHTISNLAALCRLRIYHPQLMELATRDLTNPDRVYGMPGLSAATVLWVFARFGQLDSVLPALTPIVGSITSLVPSTSCVQLEHSVGSFGVDEFSRLALALPQVGVKECDGINMILVD
eukprot:GHVN01059413.1.p1 GENE.GHVN01059413.1~~GHVN01059413.1.p1  ORF type:complete len:394 (+),score=14.00 GHVN01059413.1:615-1796(+)